MGVETFYLSTEVRDVFLENRSLHEFYDPFRMS